MTVNPDCLTTAPLTIRAPHEVLDQAEHLRTELRVLPEYQGVVLRRSDVVRLALIIGMAELARRRAAAGEASR
jgi:hypothetical protein